VTSDWHCLLALSASLQYGQLEKRGDYSHEQGCRLVWQRVFLHTLLRHAISTCGVWTSTVALVCKMSPCSDSSCSSVSAIERDRREGRGSMAPLSGRNQGAQGWCARRERLRGSRGSTCVTGDRALVGAFGQLLLLPLAMRAVAAAAGRSLRAAGTVFKGITSRASSLPVPASSNAVSPPPRPPSLTENS